MGTILDFSPLPQAIVILRFQRFGVLTLVSGVLTNGQSTDYLLFRPKFRILNFIWLSFKYS